MLAALALGVGWAAPAPADRLALVRDDNLWVMSTDGTDERQLTRSGDCSQPDWSPDGTKLVYVRNVLSDYGRDSYLWIYDMRTASAHRLLGPDHAYGGYESPRWSPDMTHIAFFSFDPECVPTECTPSQLATLHVGTNDIKVL